MQIDKANIKIGFWHSNHNYNKKGKLFNLLDVILSAISGANNCKNQEKHQKFGLQKYEYDSIILNCNVTYKLILCEPFGEK